MDTRSLRRLDRAPTFRVEDWPPGAVTEADIRTVGQLADSEGIDTDMAPCIPFQRCVILLARLAGGESWERSLTASGLGWAELGILQRADPQGFGQLLKAAEGAKEAIFRRRGRDALHERAIEGVDEPVFGGIGNGCSGQVGTRRRFSDRLLEFGLSKMDKPTFGDAREIGASVQIGQQIVYNLNGVVIGDTSTPKPQKQQPQNAIRCDSPGDNPATIDAEVVDLDELGR